MKPPIHPQRKETAVKKRSWLLVAATIVAATSGACTAAQTILTPTAVPMPTETPSAAQTPEPTPAPGTLTLQLTAIPTLTFDKSALAAPANTAFVIDFNNKDVGQAHNVHILKGTGLSPLALSRGPDVFTGSAIIGLDQTQYYVSTGLAPGQYTFVCSIHPQMVGTLTVQ
jgi:plastocyanin